MEQVNQGQNILDCFITNQTVVYNASDIKSIKQERGNLFHGNTLHGKMKIQFKRRLKRDQLTNFNFELAKKLFLEKGAKTVNIIEIDKIDFKSKSIFRYHNFHMFAYIDFGNLTIRNVGKDQSQICYNVFSKRILILAGLLFIFIFLIFQSILLSTILTLLNYIFVYQLTYSKHEKLFEKIINDCIIK